MAMTDHGSRAGLLPDAVIVTRIHLVKTRRPGFQALFTIAGISNLLVVAISKRNRRRRAGKACVPEKTKNACSLKFLAIQHSMGRGCTHD